MPRSVCRQWFTLAAVLAAAGCGGGSGPVPVRGVVKLDGQPVANAAVVFVPQTPGGREAYGSTDANGAFRLTTIEARRRCPAREVQGGDPARRAGRRLDAVRRHGQAAGRRVESPSRVADPDEVHGRRPDALDAECAAERGGNPGSAKQIASTFARKYAQTITLTRGRPVANPCPSRHALSPTQPRNPAEYCHSSCIPQRLTVSWAAPPQKAMRPDGWNFSPVRPVRSFQNSLSLPGVPTAAVQTPHGPARTLRLPRADSDCVPRTCGPSRRGHRPSPSGPGRGGPCAGADASVVCPIPGRHSLL